MTEDGFFLNKIKFVILVVKVVKDSLNVLYEKI